MKKIWRVELTKMIKKHYAISPFEVRDNNLELISFFTVANIQLKVLIISFLIKADKLSKPNGPYFIHLDIPSNLLACSSGIKWKSCLMLWSSIFSFNRELLQRVLNQ